MAELVEQVDEQDRVVGVIDRETAVREGLPHRIAVVVCRDRAGRVLVHRRGDGMRRFPGHYDTVVGGGVDVGEGYPAAAARELREELGITPAAALRPVVKYLCHGAHGPYWMAVFEVLLEPHEAEAITPDPREIAWCGWMDPQEIRRNRDGLPFVESEDSALWRYLAAVGPEPEPSSSSAPEPEPDLLSEPEREH